MALDMKLIVLLSTYYGTKYIRQRMGNLQALYCVEILGRDDASTDDTGNILEEYVQRKQCFKVSLFLLRGFVILQKTFLQSMKRLSGKGTVEFRMKISINTTQSLITRFFELP